MHLSCNASAYNFASHCCGPVGRCRFPESLGSPRPAAPPWRWVVLSPPILVGVSGAFASSVARWAQFALGDRPPESAVCGGWRRSRMTIGWLAGRPDSGQEWFTWWHARTGQMRMREARSRVPHVTSRQDSKYIVQVMSTVHRSPTINPHYPLMFLPLRPIPVIKYRDFRRP